jgi:hypothetical protein
MAPAIEMIVARLRVECAWCITIKIFGRESRSIMAQLQTAAKVA